MTTYYIHPAEGHDGNNGLKKEHPWKGFAPVAQVLLQPGDRIEVLAPGALHHTIHLRGGGTAALPVRLHFAPGRYDLYPDGMTTRKYNISNANSAPDEAKTIAILGEQARHICIEGRGAKMVCRGKMIELCLDRSENVSVSGLTFDYCRPTVSEFSVLAATPETADLAVHPDSTYRVNNGKIIWVGEGWEYTTGLAQELIPETEEVWRRSDPIRDLRIEDLKPGLIRAHGTHDMKRGRIFQLRDTFRDCVGVFMSLSRDVILQNVQFAFMHGMGVLCQFTENIVLDQVTIAPETASGRTTAAWADCAHFSGCRGKITARNCVFCGAHDDAINIHGTHLRIVEQVDTCQIRVAFMHDQTYGFQAFYPGDQIEYVHADTLAGFGIGQVKAVKMLNPKEQLLTLEEPVPAAWCENDVVENVTWTPEVEISGCQVKRIPTRGFLLTTRRKVEVSNNTFSHLHMNGIHIESDAEGWFESGSVRDMTIAKNSFVKCKGPAIRISPHNSKSNPAVHRNIEIRENEFILIDGQVAVEAGGTTGLRVVGNRIRSDAAISTDAAIQIQNCGDVKIDSNQIVSISDQDF